MAQRKPPTSGKSAGSRTSASGGTPSTAKGSAGKSASTAKSGTEARSATGRQTTTRPPARGAAGRPPAKKKGKSIVNQKQTPWGMIIAAVAVVVFAAGVVIAVVVSSGGGGNANNGTGGASAHTVNKNDPYRQPELPAAKEIKGVTYRVEGQHTHVEGSIKYDSTPPVGGNHSQYWADCSGTVYAKPIANENAVHMLEHGAIWITYNAKTLPASQLTKLKSYVEGQDRMALSPYPNLKTPISLQAWGYQLFLNNASDPRIAQFISTLRYNQKTTPEYGASCSQPTFKQHPSTFGHPLWTPAT
jgi:hypothetical protein